MHRGLHRSKREAPLEKSLVAFRVGHVAYAVPTQSVRAIELPVEAAELPHLPRGVIGVYEYRGQILPVLDLRVCFVTPLDTREARPKWVVIESGKGLVSLVVDEVSGVFSMGQSGLDPVPPLGDDRRVYHFTGVAHHDSRATFVLDLASFHSATLAVGQSVQHSQHPTFQTLEAPVESLAKPNSPWQTARPHIPPEPES